MERNGVYQRGVPITTTTATATKPATSVLNPTPTKLPLTTISITPPMEGSEEYGCGCDDADAFNTLLPWRSAHTILKTFHTVVIAIAYSFPLLVRFSTHYIYLYI